MNKAAAMAEHYVNGAPDVRGRWSESAVLAGYKQAPRADNEHVLAEIDAAQAKTSTSKLADVEKLAAGQNLDWESIARSNVKLMADIASGDVRATATQMRAIQEINLRGLGRVVERQQELVASSVVVLPMLGAEGNATVCPKCMHILEEEGKVADHVSAMRRDVGQSNIAAE